MLAPESSRPRWRRKTRRRKLRETRRDFRFNWIQKKRRVSKRLLFSQMSKWQRKQATRDDQAQEQRTTRHPETRLTRRGRARTDCYVSHLGWTLGSWWPDHCNMLACLCASWHFHSAVDHRVTKLIHPLIRRLLEHSSVYYDTST